MNAEVSGDKVEKMFETTGPIKQKIRKIKKFKI